MNYSEQIAKHLHEIYFGGNWTCSNLKQNLLDVTWQQANQQVYGFNTIATLVYHIGYYVTIVTKRMEGHPLEGSDKESFNHPPITSQQDWENFLAQTFSNVENFVSLIEALPQEKLSQNISHEKYGIYYRNLHGIIEHAHYHLGQIALIKKIVQGAEK